MEEVREVICKECGKVFYVNKASRARPRYCSEECRKKSQERQRREFNLKYINAVANNLNENSIEGIDYVECPICHEKHAQINLIHFKRHGYTNIEDVKKDFPNIQLTCQNMKNNYKGENNPMSLKNKSDLERKQSSPYSIEHYLKKYNGDEILAKQKLQEFLDSIDRTNWKVNTRLSYFINQGMSEDEAKEALRERQVANGLQWYIKKYGEELGKIKYDERINKWCKKAFTGKSHSQRADCCIEEIIQNNTENMLYGDKEFAIKSPVTSQYYKIDLTNLKNNRMIEFFGDYWHCNPKIYDKTYIRKKRKATAEQVWEHDKIRIAHLQKLGYNVMIIWEHDYIHNHDEVIKKAREFIYGED